MSNLADVALSLQRMESFIQNAVAQTVVAESAELLKPGGHALSTTLDRAVVGGIERAFNTLASQHAVSVLGAERSQRVDERQGYRSGSRTRTLVTPLGELTLTLVKSRGGVLEGVVRRIAAQVEHVIHGQHRAHDDHGRHDKQPQQATHPASSRFWQRR